MPGHHSIEKFNNDGVRTVAGKLLQVVSIGSTAPTAANVDVQGYAIGALMINTTATANNNTLYINRGTSTTAVWTLLTVN